MPTTVNQIMHARPEVVSPDMPLPDLERAFLQHRVSGFPVVARGNLVGVVSRSDIVRQLSLEQSLAELASDFHYDSLLPVTQSSESFSEIAGRMGRRIENLRVRDVMVSHVITVDVATPLAQAARIMLKNHIHRLPVVEGEKLVGILSSMDLVRWVAEQEEKST